MSGVFVLAQCGLRSGGVGLAHRCIPAWCCEAVPGAMRLLPCAFAAPVGVVSGVTRFHSTYGVRRELYIDAFEAVDDEAGSGRFDTPQFRTPKPALSEPTQPQMPIEEVVTPSLTRVSFPTSTVQSPLDEECTVVPRTTLIPTTPSIAKGSFDVLGKSHEPEASPGRMTQAALSSEVSSVQSSPSVPSVQSSSPSTSQTAQSGLVSATKEAVETTEKNLKPKTSLGIGKSDLLSDKVDASPLDVPAGNYDGRRRDFYDNDTMIPIDEDMGFSPPPIDFAPGRRQEPSVAPRKSPKTSLETPLQTQFATGKEDSLDAPLVSGLRSPHSSPSNMPTAESLVPETYVQSQTALASAVSNVQSSSPSTPLTAQSGLVSATKEAVETPEKKLKPKTSVSIRKSDLLSDKVDASPKDVPAGNNDGRRRDFYWKDTMIPIDEDIDFSPPPIDLAPSRRQEPTVSPEKSPKTSLETPLQTKSATGKEESLGEPSVSGVRSLQSSPSNMPLTGQSGLLSATVEVFPKHVPAVNHGGKRRDIYEDTMIPIDEGMETGSPAIQIRSNRQEPTVAPAGSPEPRTSPEILPHVQVVTGKAGSLAGQEPAGGRSIGMLTRIEHGTGKEHSPQETLVSEVCSVQSSSLSTPPMATVDASPEDVPAGYFGGKRRSLYMNDIMIPLDEEVETDVPIFRMPSPQVSGLSAGTATMTNHSRSSMQGGLHLEKHEGAMSTQRRIHTVSHAQHAQRLPEVLRDIGGVGTNPGSIDWGSKARTKVQKGSVPLAECQEFMKMFNIGVTGKEPHPKPITKFEHAQFPNTILEAMKARGFLKPTPIQALGWPTALSGRDMVGLAETGSGKTLAYLLPALVHVAAQPPLSAKHGPSVLILVPTRELVIQIQHELYDIGQAVDIEEAAIYGGTGSRSQVQALRRGVEIVIATPGRLLDFLHAHVTDLSRVTYLVVDEADRMLDMGFKDQIQHIVSHTRPERQTLMWSATWPRGIQDLARKLCNEDRVKISIGDVEGLHAKKSIEQHVIVTSELHRREKFFEWLEETLPIGQKHLPKMLIFCATKRGADALGYELKSQQFGVATIHSGKEQQQRQKIMRNFRNGRVHILVATDVAQRGLDISDVSYVVNYDCPKRIEDYIHRIGRTARAGAKGKSVTFFSFDRKSRHKLRMAKALLRVIEESGNSPPRDLMRIVM